RRILSMLKSITLFAFCAASPSIAASLTSTEKLASPQVEAIIATFDENLSDVQSGESVRMKYEFATSKRTVVGMIKQAVYVGHHGDRFSTPDYVTVTPLSKAPTTIVKAVKSSIAYLEMPEGDLQEVASILADKILAASTSGKSLEFYQVQDGNSFGICQRIAIVDTQNLELGMFASCYSE
ncbi:MAG: hypothetical protein NTV34_04280, partial [Proteobacteria bacterium]|nr:hypothetical protein [Pseudomonadota bacterium]